MKTHDEIVYEVVCQSDVRADIHFDSVPWKESPHELFASC